MDAELLTVLTDIRDELRRNNTLTEESQTDYRQRVARAQRIEDETLRQAKTDRKHHIERADEAQKMLRRQAERQEAEHRMRRIEHDLRKREFELVEEAHELAAMNLGLRMTETVPPDDEVDDT